MVVKFNPILLIIPLAVLLILLFGVIRSRKNTDNALAENKHLTELNTKRVVDSAQLADQILEYKDRVELQDGQLALRDNQLNAKGDSLDAANERIKSLLLKHRPIEPSADTNITVVPNEYIQDCEGCYTELAKGRDMVMNYKGAADDIRREYAVRKKGDSIQIAKLTLRAMNLTGTLRDAISAAAIERENGRPTRKILVSIGTLFIDANFPNAIGGGGGYQDRYNRIFAAKYYVSKYGGIKQFDVFIPLSFKRKR